MYVLIPHFLTISNFSTAMPRTTSSPPVAGLGWGWCSPEPGTDRALCGISSARQQRVRGHKPGCSPKSNGVLPGHRGSAWSTKGSARSTGLHRAAVGLDKAHVQQTHGPSSTHSCPGSCCCTCCSTVPGTLPCSGPGLEQLSLAGVNRLQPALHCCTPVNRLAGIMT